MQCIDRDEVVRETFKGELLQPGGVRALERLGLSHCLDAATVDAVPVEGYIVLEASSEAQPSPPAPVRLCYGPRDPATLAEQLWGVRTQPGDCPARAPRGRSFHNKRFVEALREEALRLGARCAWGECACIVEECGRAVGVAWVPRGGNGAAEVLRAPLVVVCDGMYSTLRGALRQRGAAAPETLSYLAGLLLPHEAGRPPLPCAQHGHVVLVTPSPVLFYQISARETRCLVDLPPEAAASQHALQTYLERAVAPQLPQGLLRAGFLAALHALQQQGQEVRIMPSKALARDAGALTVQGVVLLGDAASMRHPLTGGGMTVALGDVERLWRACLPVVAAAAAASGGSSSNSATSARPALLAAAAASFQGMRKNFTLSVLANALHQVFTTPGGGGGAREALRKACLQYLARGGACAAGPIGLLAGLSPSPLVLLLHFFAVACCAGLQGLVTGCFILVPILVRELWV